MEILGWIIWGVGCLSLVDNLYQLRKPCGRLLRTVFIIFLATALVLMVTRPISKYHLLWILPSRVLFGLFAWLSLVIGAMLFRRLTARRPKQAELPANSFPPFGALGWDEDAWWGEANLPAWAGFQSRHGPDDAKQTEALSNGTITVVVLPAKQGPLEPSPDQCRAMEYQIQNGEVVMSSVLTALLPHYLRIKTDSKANDATMPPVSEIQDFRKMIWPGQMMILSEAADGMTYVALEFGCEWDEEHGLGIVLHGKEVVEIGQTGDIYGWEPKSAGAGIP